MQIVRSVAPATAAGEVSTAAPSATSRSSFFVSMSCTTSEKPAFSRLRAIGPPILPSPMNPTFPVMPSSSISSCARAKPLSRTAGVWLTDCRPPPAVGPSGALSRIAEGGLSAGSVRCPAQRADLGELARQLHPSLAGILGLVEFAVMAARNDEPRVGRMRREGPNRRVRLHRQFRHAPILAAIGRALDRAGRADGAVARRDKQRVGIVRLLREAAAIGQGELAADAEPGPAFAAVMAREDLARRRRQHDRAAIDD